MTTHQSVQGSCSCGRNQYIIQIPQAHAASASVYLDNTSRARRSHATLLQPFLAIPLSWYHSSTTAHHPDETHTSIRRTYHTARPVHASPSATPDTLHSADDPQQHTQKTFCGYCGTPLSTWSDESLSWEQMPAAPSSAADRIAVTLGSLFDEHMAVLNELGILPGDENADGGKTVDTTSTRTHPSTAINAIRTTRQRGMPWFDDLVQDGELGRIRRRRGGDAPGGESVEWDVVEVDGNGDGVAVAGVTGADAEGSGRKRKVGAGDDDDDGAEADVREDVHMREA